MNYLKLIDPPPRPPARSLAPLAPRNWYRFKTLLTQRLETLVSVGRMAIPADDCDTESGLRVQVQRRFADKLKSDRTARRHLAEMQESLAYLDLVPTPSPLWPKVYSVSCRGIRILADAFRKKEPTWRPPVNDRRRVGFSVHHVYHELACTEFLLQIHESAKATSVDLLELQRRSLVKHDSFCLPRTLGSRLVPDAMALLRTSQGMTCTFVEIDTGSMSMNAVADKLRRYSDWSAAERGQTFVTGQYRKHGAVRGRGESIPINERQDRYLMLSLFPPLCSPPPKVVRLR